MFNLKRKKMKVQVLLLVALCACACAEETAVEARGKGKYALLTHLAILLATKIGLYKVVVGIALVLAAIKAMVVMAWALAIFKYVPDLWQYKQQDWHKQGLPGWHKHGLPDWQKQSLPGPSAPSNVFWDMLTSYYTQMHFFYVAATKFLILKVVYGVIFYIMATKAWHLLLWLIHYLKEKKHHEHYVGFDHDHEYHGHHDFHGHFYQYGQEYEPQPYGPSPYDKPVYGRLDKDKRIYDADGSYSIAGY